ncbi:hypothetical protein [Streptomyces sp. NPDC046685]|uniref:hypothetical protein n=1 Tax=Streptomyces sp. NPDC046685 TaxID=3157202 RepID=UPI0033EBF872
MDTHCLVTAGQRTAYGCVREAVLEGSVLRVVLDPRGVGEPSPPSSAPEPQQW